VVTILANAQLSSRFSRSFYSSALTITGFLPLFPSYYALCALAAFVFKLPLQHATLWQALGCTVDLDFSGRLAQLLGLQSTDSHNFCDFVFVVLSWDHIR
jgi:hypothetical protein